ncbi:hypothetical protein HMPREF3213_03085 [Heyndrickxia coagulans]|uniref:Uncharacterized protein n=1 Tax=Heyndrickxia coagulans TaxID=1398 RepID=A0A133KFA7_HEYCO|nr:hypothetical protein HMPREF3213_03085 [Heyndrickxia coagulans]
MFKILNQKNRLHKADGQKRGLTWMKKQAGFSSCLITRKRITPKA